MPAAQQTQVTPKETMKTAETSHLRLPFSFGFGAAYPVARYSPFAYRGISIGFGSEIGKTKPFDYEQLQLRISKKKKKQITNQTKT
jgi:hypothetical protein